MESIATFDIRGERLKVYVDPNTEHPLNMTDAPILVHTFDARYCFDSGPRTRPVNASAKPYKASQSFYLEQEDTPSARSVYAKWLFFDANGQECPAVDACGALSALCSEWQRWALAPLTLRALRATLDECAAYWRGDVYGYTVTRTFKRDGQTYDTEDTLDSCWGFYGASSIADRMTQHVRPAFRPMLRKLARRI